jgi:glycerol uptake facilitator-like aquaporin
METPIGSDSHGRKFPTVSHGCPATRILLLTQVSPVIASQVFGGFLAALLLMGIFWEDMSRFTDATLAANQPLVSSHGPAAILATFPQDNQNNLGYLLL